MAKAFFKSQELSSVVPQTRTNPAGVRAWPKPKYDKLLTYSGPCPTGGNHCGVGVQEPMAPATSGLCEPHTHKYTTFRVAQHGHISSREHAWPKSCQAQDCTSGYPKNNCHPRVMSHSLPHLTLTTSTSSLSPISSISPIFPMVSPSQTSPVIMSPSRLRSKPSTPKRSSLKTSSPEELSWTGILGQIRIKYRKDLWEILLLKTWVNLEKLVQRRPTSRHRCIPITAYRRALQTRILKMANYEKCWLHHCIDKIERIVRHLEYQLHRGSSTRKIIYEGKGFFEILRSEVCTKWEKWRELKKYELTKS